MKSAYALAAVLGLASFCMAAPADLGVWMAIGDSISHGTYSHSYRWYLQKDCIDNGVSFDAQGYLKGCYSGAFSEASYRGRAFDNEHCAQFNIWTDEVSGARFRRLTSVSGLQSSNLKNWLGVSDKLTPDNKGTVGTYTGNTFSPDTYTYMLGTNDLQGIRETSWEQIQTAVKENVGAMQMAAKNAGKKATLYLMSVTSTDKSDALAQNIARFNAWLSGEFAPSLQDSNLRVVYADVNPGLQDVTKPAGYAVAQMFAPDRIHPTDQAALLVAGNLARAMGLPGRTAGLERESVQAFDSLTLKDDAEYRQNLQPLADGGLSFSSGEESALWLPWCKPVDPAVGYTVEFRVRFGNGAKDGWDAEQCFSVLVGDGRSYGRIAINESSISWGGSILYSRDMSQNATIRVAYVPAREGQGIPAGYYVWLDGMLIGEALPAEQECNLCDGVMMSYHGTAPAVLVNHASHSAAPFAPPAR